MNTIIAKSIATLESARFYLEHIAPQQYQEALPQFSGASIGQHTRHFVEGFQCLLEQLAAGKEVNYDKRVRNQELESSPSYALRAIEEISRRLLRVQPLGEVWLNSDFGFPVRVQSSIDRELLHNIDHTIHHLAIIRIGLLGIVPDIYLPEHFGVASSTMRFRAAQKQTDTAAPLMAG